MPKKIIVLIDDQSDITAEIHLKDIDCKVIQVERIEFLEDRLYLDNIAAEDILCILVDMYMPNETPITVGVDPKGWRSDFVGLILIDKKLKLDQSQFKDIPTLILTGHEMDEGTEDAVSSFRRRHLNVPLMKKIAPDDDKKLKNIKLQRIILFLTYLQEGFNHKKLEIMENGFWNISEIDINLSKKLENKMCILNLMQL